MKFETIGIVGAGQMGTGIAQVCAAAGFDVMLNDVDASALTRGTDRLSASFERLVSKGKITAGEASEAMARVHAAPKLSTFSTCDVLIEAATENVRIKQRILQDLDAVANPDAIVATNTSSVSITKLATTLADPSRFVGMHFFNPVPAMALVEVIRGILNDEPEKPVAR